MDVKNHILDPYEIRQHLFHGAISIISLILFFIAIRMQPKRATIIFTTLSVVLLITGGGVGGVDIFFSFLTLSIPDGEWLGEGWPYLDVRAIWMFSCIYICSNFYRHSRLDAKDKWASV